MVHTRVKFWLSAAAFFWCVAAISQNSSLLKYIVYDFDGLRTGLTDLPDGDYSHGDAAHAIVASPLAYSDVIGDRVLEVTLNWQSGTGEFGKSMNRFIDLATDADRLNFYICNPAGNDPNTMIEALIIEDDNSDNLFSDANDDKWICPVSVSKSGSWQLVSLPLSQFQDANVGGNGLLDARYASPGGMLFTVAFVFRNPGGTGVCHYYLDMICFSEGAMPHGITPLDLPVAGATAGCALGALGSSSDPAKVPGEIHAFLPPGKKLTFVNWFAFYSDNGTTPDALPGDEVQQLLDEGYIPIITWESMYRQYARLDPVQPRLDAIINGDFDGYIDDFAARVKGYKGTVIMRIFHEFEGDWYPWSLTHNGQDPEKYKSAFRRVVDRFRAAGATNARWMWCLNAEPKPYARYNRVTSCYPGDDYVDIVATDIYNHPDVGTPPWKSFRYTMAESYYYLAKYYAHKPIYVCEVGSRERNPGEPGGGQSKADWICMMSKDLRSYFSRTQALVFFSTVKEHDWRINSSEQARQAFVDCIWSQSHYGNAVAVKQLTGTSAFGVHPNPFSEDLWISVPSEPDTAAPPELRIIDMYGRVVFYLAPAPLPGRIAVGRQLPVGAYLVEYRRGEKVHRLRIIRTYDR